MKDSNNDERPQSHEPQEDSEAQAYLDHLLNDGALEGDSGATIEMPTWFNEDLFIKGQTYLSKYRFIVTSGMFYGLIAVLSIPSIRQLLVCTRQSSAGATAYRRYIRTIWHSYSWYDEPPLKDKNSKFWISLRAVRKAHSKSSHACRKLGVGQITQKDLALTQYGFIAYATLGAFRIQLYDDEYLESTSHLWRVLGYLLGIKDEYNICGRNWAETKERLDIVMRRVYEPALSNTTAEFHQMTKALCEGLSSLNVFLTTDSAIYFTKRLNYVKGYEYYSYDYRPGFNRDPQQKLYYYDLGWYDRLLVSYGLFIVTYLHKYNIVRWYLNFRVWLNVVIFYYLPYIAIWRYGIRKAYVRIFTKDGGTNEFDFHIKTD